MSDKLISMLLAQFLTNAFGAVIYIGLFAYSFKKKNKFILRLILSLVTIAGVSVALAYAFHYGFVRGMETNLRNVELLRMFANTLSLAMGTIAIWVCFDEKPALILFASVLGNAAHGFATNVYALFLTLTHRTSIYFVVYNGYDWLSNLLFFLINAFVFISAYFLCARKFAKTIKVFDKKISRSVIVIFVFFSYIMAGVQGSNVYNAAFNGTSLEAVTYVFYNLLAVFDLFVIFVLRFVLVWVYTSQEKEAEKAFYDGYKEKTELQEKNMELINLKCHDMKHQLRTLLEGQNLDSEFIEETQKTISIFDAQVKTGNEALDTLLTQKSLICDSEKIQLTVMLDGAALSFMSLQDINSFFGNAIDNAVEYLSGVPEENRFIRITSSSQGSIFSIRIENYCDSERKFRKNGLPETTKEDNGYHGFGTKSIKTVAEKYNGDASFAREGTLFIVTAIFML